MDELHNDFWKFPNQAEQAVNAKELRKIMLKTGGTLIAEGRLRNLTYKRICPGLYRLFITPLATSQTVNK